MPTDLELLARVRQGEQAALAELYGRYSAKVYALALRMLKSREEAEEVLQDTFLKLYRKADSYRGFNLRTDDRAAVQTYIYTIARNESLMRLRAKRSRPSTDSAWNTDDLPAALQRQEKSDPVDVIMVEAALQELEAEDRRLVQQAFFLGYSHSELAELTSIPLGTIKTRLRRALVQLRSYLERHGSS